MLASAGREKCIFCCWFKVFELRFFNQSFHINYVFFFILQLLDKVFVMANKKTYFQEEWLSIKEFAGITPHRPCAAQKGQATEAFCSFCQKTFGLGNMGRKAVSSHVSGKNHQAWEKGARTRTSRRRYYL